MKKKDFPSISNKSQSDLQTMAEDIRSQIKRAQMEISMHKAKNTNVAKNLKKTLAQILTIKKEKEIRS